MSEQYLTAVFELRPTRRKAAVLERARVGAEALFWETIGQCRERADDIAALSEKKERKAAWKVATAEIASLLMTAANKGGLNEPIAQGLVRDVTMAVSSYIELRVGGRDAEWPTKTEASAFDPAGALDQLGVATTLDEEREGRDALSRTKRAPPIRPLTLARARDARLIRSGVGGPIAAVLNVLRATDPAARTATISAGINASTGEVVAAGVSKTKIIIPVACSKWHEQKFLAGDAILRSSLITRRGERWFMCAQFEMPTKAHFLSGNRLGIDRGIVNPVAVAVVDRVGAVITASEPRGAEIGSIIRDANRRRKSEQRRRGTTSRTHVERIGNALHGLANEIVAQAKGHGAAVIIEKLDGLKQAITATREKGTRHGGWRRVLKRGQFGNLEQILDYKLKLAGLPSAREVVAGGTSQTCPACATRDAKSRPTQERFACVSCGFEAHADRIAAVNIARRGIAMMSIKKGDKLAPVEQDMVARLRLRDDGGLGSLSAGLFAGGEFVATRATATGAYEELVSLTSEVGQNGIPRPQNARNRVFAERKATNFPEGNPGKTVVRHVVTRDQVR